jgi:hypothetical protein
MRVRESLSVEQAYAHLLVDFYELPRCACDIPCNVQATKYLRCRGLSLELLWIGLLQLNSLPVLLGGEL